MVAKIADDMEAIRAGLARLEEENRRRISGDTSPQPVPVEEYQEDLPGVPSSHWGLIGGVQGLVRLPTVKITHPIGSWRFEVDKQCYEYWVGDKWVIEEDWQDNYQHLHHHKP